VGSPAYSEEQKMKLAVACQINQPVPRWTRIEKKNGKWLYVGKKKEDINTERRKNKHKTKRRRVSKFGKRKLCKQDIEIDEKHRDSLHKKKKQEMY
jgi:hypothetical protein